jgi:hypothetical protein
VVGVRPGRANQIVYQKTLGINDWYHAGPKNEYPLGNVQALGKLQGWTIKPQRRAIPHWILEFMTQRSVDLLCESEDLPLPESRVTVDDADRIHLTWIPTNVKPHEDLVRRTASALRKAGYPLIFTQRLGLAATSHQCGTLRMGHDPSDSVLNKNCRAHDVENLWVVDSRPRAPSILRSRSRPTRCGSRSPAAWVTDFVGSNERGLASPGNTLVVAVCNAR